MADRLASAICVLVLIGSCNVPCASALDATIPTGSDTAMMQVGTNDVQTVSFAACPTYEYDTQLRGVCQDVNGNTPRFYWKKMLDTNPDSCKTQCSCEPDCQAVYELPMGGTGYYDCVIFGPSVAPEDFVEETVPDHLPDPVGNLPINQSDLTNGTCFLRGSEVVSSTGDPHLVNLRGEHFDIYQPGSFVLLQLPRRAELASTLLLVEAIAKEMGDPCSVYFQVVTISGNWTNQTEPIVFLADPHGTPSGTIRKVPWMHFGPVDVKVIHWRRSGVDFLDIYVKNVARTGHAVGGLLGADGHKELEPRPQQCSHRRVAAEASSVAVARA